MILLSFSSPAPAWRSKTLLRRKEVKITDLFFSMALLVPPKITYLNNQTASEFDEQVTLTCEASGDPTPTISWSFENRIFTEGEQVPFHLFRCFSP